MDLSHSHEAAASQTQLDQRELLQYECNLAACYEAEYLLSLKIQEDMCQRRDAYDDPSEVTCYASAAKVVDHSTDGGQLACHTQDAPMDCSVSLPHNGNCYGFTNHSETTQRMINRDYGVTHTTLCGQEQPAVFFPETNSEVVAQSGFVGEDQITHHDGPHRKRVCLNRQD